jgi:hypothetical protein
MGLDLITRAEYKTYAGISSTNNDATLDVLIPKVSDLVKSICRRSFVDYVDDYKIEYFEGGTASYMPEEWPIISVYCVEISQDYGNTYTNLVEYTDYAVNKRDGSIRCINKDFPVLINGYRVTYNAGYETIPPDLKLAVLDLVSYYLKNDSAVHTHKLAQPNTMQVEYITTTNLPAHIKRVLDLYTASYA